MSDVVEDFSTLEGVKSRFEAWKEEDPEAYSDAFVSLCLPKIVSPLVRLQLLFWNPLTVSLKPSRDLINEHLNTQCL
jgi:GC-rich sequence DNA-binding factor